LKNVQGLCPKSRPDPRCPPVEQSFKLGLSGGKKVLFGFGASREACGETRPPQFDIYGRVIPGTGVSIQKILSGKPWKWSGYPGSGNFGIGKDHAELTFGAAFFWGFEISLDVDELSERISKHIWENLRDQPKKWEGGKVMVTKNKFNLSDIIAIILMLMIYIPLLIYFLSGQKESFFMNLSENYKFGKFIIFLTPFSSAVLWFWMLFDWGSRVFKKKKYKIFWLVIFFLTFTFGSTVYYFIVRKFNKGLKI
jgi:hypothetical protein